MAVVWVFAAALAGISGDRIRIPLPKKVAITVAAIVITILMPLAGEGRRPWPAVAFILWASLSVIVMWFWN